MQQLFAILALLGIAFALATTQCRTMIEFENTLTSDAKRLFNGWNITSIELETPNSVLVRSITFETNIDDWFFRGVMFHIYSQAKMSLPESRMVGIEATCDWNRRSTGALVAMLGALAGWSVIDRFIMKREAGAGAGEDGPELVKSD
jgi:hypothetical protein